MVESVRANVRGRNQKEKINCNVSYAAMVPKIRCYLDEVFVRINGITHYLWRAVYHEGEVLETFVTKKCDRRAALKFIKKTMKRFGRPEVIVPVVIATDKLRSYRAAMRMIGNEVRQKIKRWFNNRAENSH